MKENVLFSERQRFTQWWLWLIVLLVYGLMIYDGISTYRSDGNILNDTGLVVVFGILLLVTAFVLICRLDTQIRSDGIYVRFFPIHFSFRHFTWDEIRRAYIREYRPIFEYGGWGIRYGFSRWGKAYNVSGSTGLQLELIDNKKLLIGTNKPEGLEMILNNLGQLKK